MQKDGRDQLQPGEGPVGVCRARAGLQPAETTKDINCGVERHILIAQGFEACGAALRTFNTRMRIGMIVANQLYFVVAPRTPFVPEF